MAPEAPAADFMTRVINFWTGQPNERMEELLFIDGRGGQLRRLDTNYITPTNHLTPIRVHGGVGP